MCFKFHYEGFLLAKYYLFSFAVSSMLYSRKQFGSTGLCNTTMGFRRLKIASVLISLVQCISYCSNHSLLIATCCSRDIYDNFLSQRGFEYTLNANTWPTPLENVMLGVSNIQDNKVLCISHTLQSNPVHFLTGDVDFFERRDLQLLQRLCSHLSAIETSAIERAAIDGDNFSLLSAILPTLPEDGEGEFSPNNMTVLPTLVDEDDIEISKNPMRDYVNDEVGALSPCLAHFSIMDEASLGENLSEMSAVSNLDTNAIHNTFEVMNNNSYEDAAVCVMQNSVVEKTVGAHVTAAEEGGGTTKANETESIQTSRIEDGTVEPKSQDSDSLHPRKSRRIQHSAENYDSDDEYYIDIDAYNKSINSVHPKAMAKKRKASTIGDGVDKFYKFLSLWTHLLYLRNGLYEKKRYTGYIGVGVDDSGKKILMPLTVAYVELMSGLTQGFLCSNVKSNVGFEVALPREFKQHQKQYSKCWTGNMEYEHFLKLWTLHWTHIRFFKDPNNVGKNRFQLKNCNNAKFMDYVPKLWFFECLSPDSAADKQVAKQLINDCKRETGNRWIEIPPGNSSTKEMVYLPSKELFRIRVKQPAGIQTCLFSSLANGFYFIGDELTGQLIETHARCSLQKIDRLKYAIQLTRNKQYRYNPIRYRGELFDIFLNQSEWPTLCVLVGDDHSHNHAVTVVKDWILDSNCDFAMKLTQENLDWCVSSATESVHFVKVVKAVRFFQNKKNPLLFLEKDYIT